MKKQHKFYPLTLSAALLVNAPVIYAAEGQGVYIAPSVGYYFFDGDGDNNVKDAMFYGLGIGFQLDKNFAVEAGYYELDDPEIEGRLYPYSGPGSTPAGSNAPYDRCGVGFVGDADRVCRKIGDTVSAKFYRLEGIVNIDLSQPVVPFLALGYTRLEQDPRFSRLDDKNDMISLGGGVKYMITPELAVKGEFRGLHSWDNDDTDYIANLGISYLFGMGAATPTKTPPKEEATTRALDSDNDGVNDDRDNCPNTPAGTRVDSKGCPVTTSEDDDRDGVSNSLDLCPNTPLGTKVDSKGCTVAIEAPLSMELKINFKSGSAVVNPAGVKEISKVARLMVENPNTTVIIEGHTDSRGKAAANKRLSEQRANAVRNVLIKQGVNASRVRAIGYGPDQPIADNATEAGRAQNRRVIAKIEGTVKKQSQ